MYSESFDLFIINCTIVSPQNIYKANIGIKDEKIVVISQDDYSNNSERAINANGLHAFPGIIDAHVHFRDPGFPQKEDFTSGSKAAVIGGVTTVIDMPNTIPPTSNVNTFMSKVRMASNRSFVDFGLSVILGQENCEEINQLATLGVSCFNVFNGVTVNGVNPPNDGELLQMMRNISALDLPLRLLPENQSIVENISSKKRSQDISEIREVLNSHPSIAEIQAITSYLPMAEETQCPVHIDHLSTKKGLEIISYYKKKGVKVSTETSPHYLLLTREDVFQRDELASLSPPLRNREDIDALWEGLRKGLIDMVVSDHAPHSVDDSNRKNKWIPVTGFSGVELLLPLMLNEAFSGKISLERISYLLSESPARVFGFYPQKGAIQIGADADITLVDLKAEKVIEKLFSRSNNSPFVGKKIRGWPMYTILRGDVIYSEGEVFDELCKGKFLSPLRKEEKI